MATKGGRRFGKRHSSETAPRQQLLRQITDAQQSGDREKMVEALVAVNHWLSQYGFDWAVMDAYDGLRRAYRDKENDRRS